MHQAKLYSHANELQLSDAVKVLEEFGPLLKWKGNDTLVDIGCGSGDVTVDLVLSRMPRDYKMVIGMDISEKMIKFATHKYCTKYLDLKFVQGDIGGELEYQDEFDHVTSFFCLHWVQDQRFAFKNIQKILKLGGDCLCSLLAQCPIFDAYERMSQMEKWKIYMKDVNSFISPYHKVIDPVAQAKEYLKTFEVHEVYVKERTYVYDNVDVLKASMRAVNPFLVRIPNTEKENFITDLVQQVTDMGLCKNGTFISPYKVLIIYAKK